MIGALGDCCAGGCPISSDPLPLAWLAMFDLELVLLEAATLVAANTVHHSAAD